MITPSAMELLSFVVLKDKAEQVAQELLRLGIFHPVDLRQIEEKLKGLSPAQIEKENTAWETLQEKSREVSRRLKLNIKTQTQQDPSELSYAACEEMLNNLEQELAPLSTKKSELQEELVTNQAMLAQVKEYLPFPFEKNSLYSFLETSVGRIEEKNIALLERSLKGIPHVLYPFRKQNGYTIALIIGLRRDRVLMEKVLEDVAWQEVEYPKESETLSRAAEEKIKEQIEEGRQKIKEIDTQIAGIGQAHTQDLARVNATITLKRSLLEAKRYSCATDKTVIFCGWVPEQEKEKFIRQIKAISGISYLESKEPEQLGLAKEEVPVRFQHSPAVKPFELLIEAYGIPRYGTIDPTIFVAISFLVMFGAMFGDLGHGLALIITGLLLLRKKFRANLKQAGALILYCGASASIFGLLYGSFFGFEFNSLWIKPMEDILGVLRASIFLGMAMISVGIILNVINAVRDRDYLKAAFDKAGLIGGIIYWLAIAIVIKIFVAKTKIPGIYLSLIFLSILVVFLYPLAEILLKRRHGNLIEAFMESLVNILEIFMGYLANTVSFIRVAAFALAHAGLFLAIFSLSRLTQAQGGWGTALSWVIIIFGNIIVVCLEGLIVSIQSLRLNYYEFFSKFFMSGKQEYKPLSI